MSVIRRSAGADWLDRLADYLTKEDRFTTDATIPDGASTVDRLRVAADELEGAVEALRRYGRHDDGCPVGEAVESPQPCECGLADALARHGGQ